MVDNKYLINNRFLVDPQTNCIKDKLSRVDHHLEPRLMEVLCAFVKSPGTLITRETLIQNIWSDYPGADEGLTQAISSLRKLLEDDSKEIIKTIPKKGYMLMAPVIKTNDTTGIIGKSTSKVFYVTALGVLLAMSLFLLIFNRLEPSNSSQIKTTEVVFPKLEETNESNYLNTITTTDSSGNRYRLIMIGDRRPKFYVNDSLRSDMESYTGLIDQLSKELWKRQSEAENEKNH